MRKGTLLTSFIVDEITAQARYRDHLTEAAQRRLVKLARASRPSLADWMRQIIGICLSAWGQWVKGYARERTVGPASGSIGRFGSRPAIPTRRWALTTRSGAVPSHRPMSRPGNRITLRFEFEQQRAKDDSDPKALACCGPLVGQGTLACARPRASNFGGPQPLV